MAKFVYRMQSILNIKEKMEGQAKMEFAAARMQLDEEEVKLAALRERRAFYLEEGAKIRTSILEPVKMKENEASLRYIKDAIILQQKEVRRAELALEAARHKLQEYMIERKTQEQLKETAFEQFKADLAKEESKEVDELVSYVYGQKKET